MNKATFTLTAFLIGILGLTFSFGYYTGPLYPGATLYISNQTQNASVFSLSTNPFQSATNSLSTSTIWVVNSHSGTVTKLSNTGATLGIFTVGSFPTGVAIDSNGNVWVANYGNSTVTKLSNTGATLGTFKAGSNPLSIIIDGSDNVWVANYGSGTVTKLSNTGATLGTFTVGSYPYSIAIDSNGNVWVANYGNSTVTKLSNTGATLGTFKAGSNPLSIIIDGSDNVWVANYGSGTVTKLSNTGATLGTFTVGSYPYSIAIDSNGNVWVANYGNSTVTKLSNTGATLGTFTVGSAPFDIAVESSSTTSTSTSTSTTTSTSTSTSTTTSTISTTTKPTTSTTSTTSTTTTEGSTTIILSSNLSTNTSTITHPQYIALLSKLYNGISTYNYVLFSGSSSSCSQYVTNTTTSNGAVEFMIYVGSTTTYCVAIVSNGKVLTRSNSVTITYASSTSTNPTISPLNSTITSGQPVTFSTTWSGNNFPYALGLYSSSTSSCSPNSATELVSATANVRDSSGGFTFPAVYPKTSTYYCIVISSEGSGTYATSPVSKVTVNPIPKISYYLAISSNNASLGNVITPNSGSYSYLSGSNVLISAEKCLTFNCEGWMFVNWSGLGHGSYSGFSNSITITMNNNITEVANYRFNPGTTTTTTISPTQFNGCNEYFTIYVGDSISCDGYDITFQALGSPSTIRNGTSAIFYVEGTTLSILPHHSGTVSIPGHIITINVNYTFPGLYSYQKWAIVSINVVPTQKATTTSFLLNMSRGWNLISFPVNLNYTTAAISAQSSNCQVSYENLYDNSTSSYINVHLDANLLTQLEQQGNAIWIYAGNSCVNNFTIVNPPNNFTMRLNKGFNFISDPIPTTQSFNSLLSSCNTTYVYGYNTSIQNWYSPSVPVLGTGYLVHVPQACNIYWSSLSNNKPLVAV